MWQQIEQRFAQFEPQAVLDAALGLVPDVLAALLVLALFFVLFRISRTPLSLVLRRAGMHDKLVELLVDSIHRYGMAAIALDDAGVEIPFPHLQLFVETVEDRVWQGAGNFLSEQSAA